MRVRLDAMDIDHGNMYQVTRGACATRRSMCVSVSSRDAGARARARPRRRRSATHRDDPARRPGSPEDGLLRGRGVAAAGRANSSATAGLDEPAPYSRSRPACSEIARAGQQRLADLARLLAAPAATSSATTPETCAAAADVDAVKQKQKRDGAPRTVCARTPSLGPAAAVAALAGAGRRDEVQRSAVVGVRRARQVLAESTDRDHARVGGGPADPARPSLPAAATTITPCSPHRRSPRSARASAPARRCSC